MEASSAVRSGDEVRALSLPGAAGNSAGRPAVQARPAVVDRVDRVVGPVAAERPPAYIGRKRWLNARLTFSGRCRPRTLRL